MARFIRTQPLVFVAALLPLGKMVWDFMAGTMADPVAITLNRLGFWTLTCLCIVLTCTPAKTFWGWTWLNKSRRTLGLVAFFYGMLHFLVYVIVDKELDFVEVGADIVKRKFITVGFVALLLMIPLAVTSTQAMVKRLGFRAWKRLHRGVYAVAVLGVIHFVWRVKADLTMPIVFATAIAVLLALRLVPSRATLRPRDRSP